MTNKATPDRPRTERAERRAEPAVLPADAPTARKAAVADYHRAVAELLGRCDTLQAKLDEIAALETGPDRAPAEP